MIFLLRQYCTIGINHHLIFPGVLKDAHFHERSLYSLLSDGYFDVIDMSLPDDTSIRNEEIKMIREYRKKIICNFPLFCLGSPELDVNSLSEKTRRKTLDEAKKHLDYAAAANVSTVTFAAGVYRRDIPEKDQLNAFLDYSVLFNEEAKQRGILPIK